MKNLSKNSSRRKQRTTVIPPPFRFEEIKQICKDIGWYNDEPYIRPFYPGGDYQKELPQNGKIVFDKNGEPVFDKKAEIVLDNPPFSILKSIVEFYNENNIKYILYGPALTALCYIKYGSLCFLCDDVVYENGARVKTLLMTNIEKNKIYTKRLKKIIKEKRKINDIPEDWLTAGRILKCGRREDQIIDVSDYEFKRKLTDGTTLFGGALSPKK